MSVSARIEADGNGLASAVVIETTRAQGWTFRVDAKTGRSLTITTPEGEPLAAETIRALPLGEVIREAAHAFLRDRVENRSYDRLRRIRAEGGSRAEVVARMYRAALEEGLPPARAIAAVFDRDSPVSAQRWIAEARRAGLLKEREEEVARHRPGAGPDLKDSRAVFHVKGPEVDK